jgi:hypothetical protein
VPARKRVLVWYLAATPVGLLLLALLFLGALLPDGEAIGFAAGLLIVFSAPVAWVVALVAAVQHRREWPLVLPLALFVVGGVFLVGSVFGDSSLAAYCGLALTLLALGLATWIGWAPVLRAPGDRAARIRALGAAALGAAGRRMRLLVGLAAFAILFDAVSLLVTGEWVQGGLALLVGLGLLPASWPWLRRVAGRAAAVRTRRTVGERPAKVDEMHG